MDQLTDEQLEDRYSRQIRFPKIGLEGQRKIAGSRVLLIGCGALGSVLANTIVRSGVGFVRIVDRDFLELSNLQRQVLFTEANVANHLPKAVAAAERLRLINRHVEIEPVVSDVDSSNVEQLCEGVDLILDGTDNFEVRFLINDVAVKHSIPWVYGGCLGADGQSMTIVPNETACLNCLMLDGPPAPGTSPTCDSFGILSPIINVIASIQAMEAIKILSGNSEAISRKLSIVSMWSGELRTLDLKKLREEVDCPTCKQQTFQWLNGDREGQAVTLCGRNSVQLSFAETVRFDFEELKQRLGELGRIESNGFLLRFYVDSYVMTIFPDGRAIVSGTEDTAIARKLYAQYLGS